MKKLSAGLLLFRRLSKRLEVFLVHPGGPFWRNKDLGAWSIPKGEFTNEEPLLAAIREMEEETGIVCSGDFITLTPVKQKSGKIVYAWALEKDIDAAAIKSNLFDMEWPAKSGKYQRFPEVDKGQWFSLEEASHKIIDGQKALLDELALKQVK